MTVCVCEKTSQHAASPALVEGRERIGRGVYFSMHYNKAKTRITNQFLKRRDLASGDLSVWRLGEPYGAQVEDVAAILEESGPGGSELSHIYYAGAENIRFVEAASVMAQLLERYMKVLRCFLENPSLGRKSALISPYLVCLNE